MRNCCGINTLSVLKTFCLMYDNLLKILSRTLSRQSRLQLLMYYLIIIIDPKQTSFVKSLFSVLSINLTYVDEER